MRFRLANVLPYRKLFENRSIGDFQPSFDVFNGSFRRLGRLLPVVGIVLRRDFFNVSASCCNFRYRT